MIDIDIQFPRKALETELRELSDKIIIDEHNIKLIVSNESTPHNTNLGSRYLYYIPKAVALRELQTVKKFKDIVKYIEPFFYLYGNSKIESILSQVENQEFFILNEISARFNINIKLAVSDHNGLIASLNKKKDYKAALLKKSSIRGLISIYPDLKHAKYSEQLENNHISSLLTSLCYAAKTSKKGAFIILAFTDIFSYATLQLLAVFRTMYQDCWLYRPVVGASYHSTFYLIGKEFLGTLSDKFVPACLTLLSQVDANKLYVSNLFDIDIPSLVTADVCVFNVSNMNYQKNKFKQIRDIMHFASKEADPSIFEYITITQISTAMRWAVKNKFKLNKKLIPSKEKIHEITIRNLYPTYDPRLKVVVQEVYSSTKSFAANLVKCFIQSLYKTSSLTITEGTGGNGGDSFRFAEYFKHVNCIEYNLEYVSIIKYNLDILKIKNIDIYHSNYLTVLNEESVTQDLVYLDPPWGGDSYRDTSNTSLFLGKIPIYVVCKRILSTKIALAVFLKVPLNFDLQEFMKQGQGMRVTISDCRSFFILHIVLETPKNKKCIKAGAVSVDTVETQTFTINVQLVPIVTENKLIPILMSQEDYAPWKGGSVWGKDITKSQVISLRRQLLRMKFIKKSFILKTNFNKIKTQYQQSGDILAISNKYKLPPMTLFQKLMLDKYNITIHQFWADNANHLSTKEQKLFELVKQNDCLDTISPTAILKISEEYENTVAKWLDARNIKYREQEELVKEQTKKYGKPIATPDFLLIDPIKINGKLIYWIEAKNYYGTTQGFTYSKNKKQIERYVNMFGAGALCFSLGCVQDMVMNETIMISIS